MKTFTDTAKREWAITLNVDAMKRVRSLCEVDLMAVVKDGGALLSDLSSDPCLLCDVIYAVCKPDADVAKITAESFGQAMAGDPIEAATTALLEELVDFFPATKRAILRRVFEKMNAYQEKALALANAKLDDPALDEKIEEEIERAMQSPPGDSPTSVREFSD